MNSKPKILHLLVLSLLSGVLLSIAWPSNGFPFLLFIGWVPLLIAEQKFQEHRSSFSKTKRFFVFYCCFVVWNILTTWWVYFASDVGGCVAMGLNALFMNFVFWAFHQTKIKCGNRIGYISLPVYWIAFEYLHLNWEISWPWLTLGNGFSTCIKWIQWYEYTGALGGTLWILAVNILIVNWGKSTKYKVRSTKAGLIISIIVLPILISYFIYNKYSEKTDPVHVVVVQPNVDPYNEKFSVLTSQEQVARFLQLASTAVDSSTDYLIGPETALPFSIWEEDLESSAEIKMLRIFLKPYPHLHIVIGASTDKVYPDEKSKTVTARKFKDADEYYDSFNTALQLDNEGPIQIYHKSKLVPGVEKMPYPQIFGFLGKFAIDLGGTSGSLGMQSEASVFNRTDNHTKIAPAICYESIYGGYIADFVRKGAELIFIITNDGWWGDTPGYKQHVQYARLRAIEMRRCIARSANTGISCFINQRGDLQQTTPWWKEEVIKTSINKNNEMTFYAKHGDYLGRAATILTFVLLLLTLLRRKP